MKKIETDLYPTLKSRNEGPFYSSYGENLFHLVCRLNIKCLIEIVWSLAEKVFKEESKDYFWIKNIFKYNNNRPFNYTFDVEVHTFFFEKSFLLDSKYYTSIDKFRNMRHNEMIDFNEVLNFPLTPVYFMLEIAKKFELSNEQKLILTEHSIPETEFQYYKKEVFF